MANQSEHHERGIHHKQPARPNSLAVGFFCPVCDSPLDKAERPCPWGPHPEEVPC